MTVSFKEMEQFEREFLIPLSIRPILDRTGKRCKTLTDFKELAPDAPDDFLLAWMSSLDANEDFDKMKKKYWKV